jgi:hypothetical protein
MVFQKYCYTFCETSAQHAIFDGSIFVAVSCSKSGASGVGLPRVASMFLFLLFLVIKASRNMPMHVCFLKEC